MEIDKNMPITKLMDDGDKEPNESDNSLCHYNPYHDPETGEFMSADKFNSLPPERKQEILKFIENEGKYKKFLNDNPQIDPVEDFIKNTSISAKAAGDALKPKPGTTIRGTYPELTDQELQQRINRLQNEQRYSDLVGDTKYVKSGSEKFKETLQTIGAVAGIAAVSYPIVKEIAKSLSNSKKKGGK